MRALQKVLGDEESVITYVDYIVLHSPGFDDNGFVYLRLIP